MLDNDIVDVSLRVPMLLVVVLFGKLTTVDEADDVDVPLLKLVPVVIEVVAVTVPDVVESAIKVDDEAQPIPRPRTPVQSVVVDEDDAGVVYVPTEVVMEDEEVGSGQPMPRPSRPSQDDVEVEATEVVVGEPEVTGEVQAGWLEVVDDEVGGGQPIPRPSSPSHDDVVETT